MSAQKRSMSGAVGGFLGFLGMSALAGVLVTAAVTPAIAVTGYAANSGISLFENLPGYLKIDALPQRSNMYAMIDGQPSLMASFFDQNREAVGWDQTGQFVKDAAVAGEDARFYEHGGVDIQGTVRGVLSTVLGNEVQGGSSITQQYVKNVLINNGMQEATTEEEQEAAYLEATKQTPDRKLKEIRYAIALEKIYSKDEILLGYLNIAHFGGVTYGIQSAAQYYYGVDNTQLTLAQAASLIAITQTPNALRLDMPDDPDNGAANGYALNKDRRDYILGAMLQYKKITQEQYDEAIATPIEPSIHPPSTGCQTAGENGSDGFFCDYVTAIIRNELDDPATTDVNEGAKLLEEGGLDIYTTLDVDVQGTSVTALNENVPQHSDIFDVGAATVTVEVGTGRVLSMAQNKKYSEDPDVLNADPSYAAVNFNTDYAYGGSTGFQPGSTYKVYTLAEWLNEGHSLRESFDGRKRTFTNFQNSCDGNPGVSFAPNNDDSSTANNAVDATKFSVNSAFVAMAQQMDLCNIKKTAQAFGVHRADGNPLQMNPSDVLGTQEIAPLTMAVAYAGIANNGLTCSPIAIDRIVGPDGAEIAPPKSTCTQSVSPEVAHAMQYAMQQTFVGGGTAATSDPETGIPHIGKTGTTDGAKDTWMDGASTKAATVVWVGNVTGDASMRAEYFDSGRAAEARHRIWPRIMAVLDGKYGGDAFPEPDPSAFRNVLLPIPPVQGLALDAAQAAIEGAGFVFEYGGEEDSPLPKGQVTRSDPSGEAGRGAQIRVFTSNGNGAVVPNVVGQTVDKAKAALIAAGFVVKTDPGNAGANWVVTAQDPAGNAGGTRGATVTLAAQAPGSPPGGGGGPGGGGSPGDD